MTDDPKLTEAQINDLRMVASPDCEWREVKRVVARMVADADQTARAEGWDEGWDAGCMDSDGDPQNPYRSTP